MGHPLLKCRGNADSAPDLPGLLLSESSPTSCSRAQEAVAGRTASPETSRCLPGRRGLVRKRVGEPKDLLICVGLESGLLGDVQLGDCRPLLSSSWAEEEFLLVLLGLIFSKEM
eukprot:GGOE01032365.1.p3 GENE.GGOE01032365.1~~GGOE01032365.1.p3  ORF type:complete len:114 (+),score=21.77 GGOE01032365.1:775-1116(+)